MNLIMILLIGVAGSQAREPVFPSASQPMPPASAAPPGLDPVYPADFFTSFQPQTALDMLRRDRIP